MFFSILNFFFTAIIIILFIRYFIERYRFYGFGPVLVMIVTLTERILQPIRVYFPRKFEKIQEQLPLYAIAVTLVLRGLMIWIFGEGTQNDFVRIHDVSGHISLLDSIAVSLSMGMLLITEMLIALLFASMMVSRRGITLGGNAGFMCFQDRTFAIFQWTQKYIKSNNLVTLFLCSTAIILFVGALAAALLSGTFVYGIKALGISGVISIFEVLQTLLQTYWFVLLLAILTSWIGADQFSMVVQIVRALADPYLDVFRRLMPWARIDFIDLSPIFAFLVINPGLMYLLMYLRALVLQSMLRTMTWI